MRSYAFAIVDLALKRLGYAIRQAGDQNGDRSRQINNSEETIALARTAAKQLLVATRPYFFFTGVV